LKVATLIFIAEQEGDKVGKKGALEGGFEDHKASRIQVRFFVPFHH
jgi:hypothetical protein